MPRLAPLFLFLCLAGITFAQTSSTSSPRQLVYVLDGSTLATYNIDLKTLQATEVGTTNLPQSAYGHLVPSPNGHNLYYSAYQNFNEQGKMLYVYGTNSLGLPNSEPIQTFNGNGLYSYLVDPNGKYFYLVYQGADRGDYATYTIVRVLIDPKTGKLGQRINEAKYELDSGVGGSEGCALSLFGMDAAGTTLYDEIDCGYPGGSSETFYERTVDTNSGSLGPDQQVYAWNHSDGTAEYVNFVQNLMFDYVIPNDWQENIDYLDVYPLQANVTLPLIHCTASMLSDCGGDFPRIHPSGKYAFMLTGSGNTNIDLVDLNSQQIVPTSSSIPYEVQQFSPDGTIAYAATDLGSALNIEIYGFNVTNAQVTPGGSINVPWAQDFWLPVERH